MEEIFILLADVDGTMRSINEPWGAAVDSEDEAKRYTKVGGIGFTHSYVKLKVFKTFDEAREVIFGKHEK